MVKKPTGGHFCVQLGAVFSEGLLNNVPGKDYDIFVVIFSGGKHGDGHIGGHNIGISQGKNPRSWGYSGDFSPAAWMIKMGATQTGTVGFGHPVLKNDGVRQLGELETQYSWEHKKWQPNHQPAKNGTVGFSVNHGSIAPFTARGPSVGSPFSLNFFSAFFLCFLG